MKAVACVVLAALIGASAVRLDAQTKPPAAGRATPPAAGRATAPPAAGRATTARRSPGAGPVIVFETVKGTFEIETYPNEAPKSVAHILALAKRGFFNGLRVHRLVPGFVVQFGDPTTKDFTKKHLWGYQGSGKPIGVAEMNKKRPHKLGAVALAHGGNPAEADSQMYIALTGPENPQIANLEGDYTVFGQVISGMDVVQKLAVPDLIRRATVVEPARGRGAAPR